MKTPPAKPQGERRGRYQAQVSPKPKQTPVQISAASWLIEGSVTLALGAPGYAQTVPSIVGEVPPPA
jgi:hypothetical protein